MKINLSTGWRFDSPPSLKKSFIWAQELGFDGVELVINSENLFHGKNFVKRLSEKYQVPIRIIHCPIVTMPFLWPLKYGVNKTFDYASFFDASLVVIHPPKMKGYQTLQGQNMLAYLSEKQKKYPEIKITLENFESDNKGTKRNLEDLRKLLTEFNFSLTLDVNHVGFTNYKLPEVYRIFKDKIKNIHFSNQTTQAEHLPPYKGNLNLKDFLKNLKKDNYLGNLTLELLYQPFISSKKVKADIEKSINFIRKVFNE